MKIIQLTAIDLTIYRFLVPLICAMRAEGWEVHFACAEGEKARLVEKMGFPFHPIRTTRRLHPAELIREFLDIYRLLRRERPHVLHVHTPIAAFVARLAAGVAGVPFVVYTAHGFYHHEGFQFTKRWFFALPELVAGRLLTDLIFFVSGEDENWARRNRLLPHERMVHIGEGTDLSLFSPSAVDHTKTQAIRQEIGPGRIILTCGRVVKEKGFFELAEASANVIKDFPDAVFVLAGQGPELGAIRDFTEKMGISENWRFLGYREDMRELLFLSEVFVLASWREGMPRSIIEAMAMGKPVVATNIRGCREEVVHGKTGFLVPHREPEVLAKAIVKLLGDPGIARQMGQKGRERTEQLFDESKVIQRQIEAIKRFVAD